MVQKVPYLPAQFFINDISYGLLRIYFQELLDILQKNLDVRIAIGGGTITKETALNFLQEKLKTAEKLIAFWEANPKDTNAIFFFREYHRYMEEG